MSEPSSFDSPVVVEKKKRRGLPKSFGISSGPSAKKTKSKHGRAGQTHMDSFFEVEQSDIQETEESTPVVAALPENFIEYEIENVKLKFPFRAYDSQISMMERLIRACRESQNALLESPTGTGKTLAILVSALAWQQSEVEKNYEKTMAKIPTEGPALDPVVSPFFGSVAKMPTQGRVPDPANPSFFDSYLPVNPTNSKDPLNLNTVVVPYKKPKIYYASRTQKQIDQVVKELKRNTLYRPRMSILGSRDFYCVNPEAIAEPNRNDACEKILDKAGEGCLYHTRKTSFLSNAALLPGGANELFDIEDLVRIGQKEKACPYFGARHLAAEADIVFMPYNYLIDPLIRESSEINLKGNIVIIDEAHNVEDTSASAGTVDLPVSELSRLIGEVEAILNTRWLERDFRTIQRVIKALLEWRPLFDGDFPIFDGDRTCRYFSGPKMEKMFQEVGIDQPLIREFKGAYESIRMVLREDQNKVHYVTSLTMNTLRTIGMILGLVFTGRQVHDYKMVLTKVPSYDREKQSRVEERLIGFWCLNSSVVFKPIADEARSVILTSGTLSPMVSFASELATSFEHDLEADHVIKNSQIWVGSISTGPKGTQLVGNYKNYNSVEYQEQLGFSILRILKIVPKGVLIFMPSYGCMEKLFEAWNNRNGIMSLIAKEKQVFEEPRRGKKQSFEQLIKDYEKAVKVGNGAVLFCVQRGKMSEGIDFSNDLARAVICIGIPYPNFKDLRVTMKKEYNNANASSKKLLSGQEWYDIQAFRALNQAVGRCIRHQNDWGAIILLDARFQQSRITQSLSKWLRPRIKHYPKLQMAANSMKEFVAANLEVAAIETAPVAAESVKENSVTAGDSKTSMNTTQPTAAIKELKGEMEVFEIL